MKKGLTFIGLFLIMSLSVFLVPSVSSFSCGDGICNGGENFTSCAADCGSYACAPIIDCAYVAHANGTYAEYSQFISGGAGVLVWDRDEDGIVDAADLFGGRNLVGRDVDNGFEDLALLDSDGNGFINNTDTNYLNLQIWKRNSTSLELVNISDTNITKINLAYRDHNAGLGDPIYWSQVGTFNSSEFIETDLIMISANFTINLISLNSGKDFLVLDLDNSSTTNSTKISTNTCTQCSTPITINLESPANNTEESSDSTPSFVFNATDNSATVNCTLMINSSGTVTPYANNPSVLNVTSTTMTANASLSNADYSWWISCSDDSVAPVTVYTSFKRYITLLISAVASAVSPQTYTGGTAIIPLWENTFVEDKEEFSEKGVLIKDLPVKQRIRTKINGEQHFIGVIGLTDTTATINISSTPQQAIFNIGEEKKFDVNDDEYYDLFIKLNFINDSKANLELRYIHEEKSSLADEIGEFDETGKTFLKNKKLSVKAIILVVIAVIIYLYRKKLKILIKRI